MTSLSGSTLRQCMQREPLDLLVLLSQANGAVESMFMARGEDNRLSPVRRAP